MAGGDRPSNFELKSKYVCTSVASGGADVLGLVFVAMSEGWAPVSGTPSCICVSVTKATLCLVREECGDSMCILQAPWPPAPSLTSRAGSQWSAGVIFTVELSVCLWEGEMSR